jgi:hypothetical protein
MKTNSKIYQLKQIVKQIAVLQKTIKQHRKTVNFKGEQRETIELVTYDHVLDQNRNWKYVPRKTKVYLTPSNAQNLLQSTYGWKPSDDKSDNVNMGRLNIIDMGGKWSFSNTSYMAWVFNMAYALLRYERKTKKNEQFEQWKKELEERNIWHDQVIKQIMETFRDEEE